MVKFSQDLDGLLVIGFTESVVFQDINPFTITYTPAESAALEKSGFSFAPDEKTGIAV